MKSGGLRLFPRHLGAIIGVGYAYGVLLGIIGLLWSWANGRGMPQLEWWQFLLAPFAIGGVAFLLEGVGTFLSNGFTFGSPESAARRRAGEVALVVLLLALLIGWPLYQISRQ